MELYSACVYRGPRSACCSGRREQACRSVAGWLGKLRQLRKRGPFGSGARTVVTRALPSSFTHRNRCQLVPGDSKVASPTIAPWLEKLTSSDVWRSGIVTWYSAIVATIALAWNVFRDVRSKGALRVQAVYQPNMEPQLPPALAVRVTNVGSKAVLVQGIAIRRKKGFEPRHHFFPCQVPKMLAPGDSLLQVLDRTGWLPLAAERVYAWDSSGRHWRMTRREFRSLLNQNRRLFHDPQLRPPSPNFPGVA